MKSYTVRIELQNSVLGDYESLHTAMESAGFRKFIISDQGTKYKLPNGEYNISGNFDRATILSLAKNAVAGYLRDNQYKQHFFSMKKPAKNIHYPICYLFYL